MASTALRRTAPIPRAGVRSRARRARRAPGALSQLINNPSARPTPSESLEEIIRIASDVIEAYDTNFPASTNRRTDIIRGLRDHTGKLEKIHTHPETLKETHNWIIMAKSSFEILNVMKGLLGP